MTPEKAIEIKETPEPGYFSIPIRDRRVANNLSIEALKFRLRWEQQEGEDDFPLLPGETEGD